MSLYYNGLVAGMFYYSAVGLKSIVLVAIVILFLYDFKLNHFILKSIDYIPIIVFVLTVILQFVFPSTNEYNDLEYRFNKDRRQEIITMLTNKNPEIVQVNINTYILPFRLRLASHDAKVITERNEGLKVLFYAHRGITNNAAVIYNSKGDGVKKEDFNIEYREIKQIDMHWYIVKF
ncbi:MAG: hypothetical protein J5590_07040 [Clostridia bacterium]|nr:hypothetical protein [Clostridia bacterium]